MLRGGGQDASRPDANATPGGQSLTCFVSNCYIDVFAFSLLQGSSVRLFGHDFPMSGLLMSSSQDTLTSLFLQRYLVVESARVGWLSAAQEAREFLVYLRHVSYNYAGLSEEVDSVEGGGDGGMDGAAENNDCLTRFDESAM